MEGLSRQLQLLNDALQPLDLSCAPAESNDSSSSHIVAELQVTLARATALAQWAALHQQLRKSHNGRVSLKRHAAAAAATTDTDEQRHGTRGPSNGRDSVGGASVEQRSDETLLSVAAAMHVSVDDLRRWNPQLPSRLNHRDVLPPDTYLKVRLPTAAPTAATASVTPLRTAGVVAAPQQPRLAAPSSASRSAARSSAGRSSDPSTTAGAPSQQQQQQTQYHPHQHHHPRPSLRSNTSSASTAAAGLPNVHVSVNSGLSGSVGRLSGWASHSPQLPEPSVPNGDASADPPTCAPAPVMLGMVEVASPGADEGDGRLSGGDYDLHDEVASSPSPERQGVEVVLPEAADASQDPSFTAPPPPPQPHQQHQHSRVSPSSPSQSVPPEPDNAPTATARSPRRTSAGASSSCASAQEIRTRGHSQSPSNSLTALSVDRLSVSTPRQAGPTTMTVTTSSPLGAGAAAAAETGVRTRLAPALTAPAAVRRMAPASLVDAAEGSASASLKEGKYGEAEAGRRRGRDPSVSLSALSPASSTGDERESSVRVAAAAQREGAAAAAPAAFVTSPSLEAPSSASSVSPRDKVTRPGRQRSASRLSSSSPINGSGGAAAVTGPDFSTPIQQRQQQQRRPPPPPPPPLAATAVVTKRRSPADLSCSPVSPSSHAASSRQGSSEEGSSSSVLSEGDEDTLENDVEDTPSTRIPATLGRHACSPPPTLSRTRRSLNAGVPLPKQPTAEPARRQLDMKASNIPSPRYPVKAPLPESKPAAHTPSTPSPSPAVKSAEPQEAFPLQENAASPSPPPSHQQPHQPPPSERAASAAEEQEEEEEEEVPSVLSASPVPFHGGAVSEEEAYEEGEAPNARHAAGDGGGEGEDDYDTLEGIAAAYNLTVATIVEWNPYLKKYAATEPLPPDLPIVLPMSDDDEDDEGGVVGENADGEDEVVLYGEVSPLPHLRQQPEQRPGQRHSSTPLDSVGFSPDNSPAPVPPSRYQRT